MAIRNPLYWNGTDLQEMSAAQKTAIHERLVYLYGGNPSVTLDTSVGAGNLTAMIDTFARTGAATSQVSSYASAAATQDAQFVDVEYTGTGGSGTRITNDLLDETLQSTTTPTDTLNRAWPVYYDGAGSIVAMNSTDMFDTFMTQALDYLASSTDTDGTFRIHTASTLAGHETGVLVFENNVSNLGSAAIGAAGSWRQNPVLTDSFYVLRTSQGTRFGTPTIQVPVLVNASNELQEYSTANFDTMMTEWIRDIAATYLRYDFYTGAQTDKYTKGSAIVDTRKTGSTYFTYFAGVNAYRTQEYPSGTASAQTTYDLRIWRTDVVA